jgi:hypothetical protein
LNSLQYVRLGIVIYIDKETLYPQIMMIIEPLGEVVSFPPHNRTETNLAAQSRPQYERFVRLQIDVGEEPVTGRQLRP